MAAMAAATAAATGAHGTGSFDAPATRQLYEPWAGEAAVQGRDDGRGDAARDARGPKPGKD